MSQKPFLFVKILLVLLVFSATSYAENLKILPKKKPDLDKEIIAKKIVQGVLKPKPKPKKDIEIKKKEIKKTQKKIEKIEDKSVTKKKVLFLVPKSKPLIVKKEIEKSKKKSKYFRQKDYILAKKAIQEIEKKKWSKALAISKKAKDKSIYNFIQWRHLLTQGNTASFYDYQTFINRNTNYPRINRVKYLAEHKLSTKNISPKKIIEWFDGKEPLSGYGKLILGESHIANGNNSLGTELIKEGFMTHRF